MTRRRERLGLLLILLLGVLVRASAMSGRVLLDDEARFARAVARGYGHLLSEFGGNVTQPAFLLLARSSQVAFGGWLGTDAALRLPSMIFGVLGIAVVARLAHRLAQPKAALWAALVVALGPYHVFYSQMATAYAMASTLSLLSFLFFLDLVGGPEVASPVRSALAYLVVTALALYTHLGSAGVVVGQGLCLAFVARGSLQTRVRVAAVMGVAGVAGLALYAPVWQQLLEFRTQWTEGAFSFDFVPFTLTAGAGGRGLSIYAFLATGLLGLVAVGRSRNRREALSVLVLWPTGLFVFYWLNGSSHYPWANTRFLFLGFPAAALAVGVGLQSWVGVLSAPGGVARKVAACAVISILAASQLTKVAEVAWGSKDAAWPEVFDYLETTAPEGTTLVSMPLRFSSLEYYDSLRPSGAVRVVGARDLRRDLERPSRGVLEPPLAFAVDLVPFNGPPWDDDWVVQRFGSTTVLYRANDGRGRNRHLGDLLRVTEEVVAYVERKPVPRDWVYWRIDHGHQHLFRRFAMATGYRRLLAAAAARVRSPRSPPKDPLDPDDFEDRYWSMLEPHVDFLPTTWRSAGDASPARENR